MKDTGKREVSVFPSQYAVQSTYSVVFHWPLQSGQKSVQGLPGTWEKQAEEEGTIDPVCPLVPV